ncbi:MAG: GNAT family N-acetyltransferase [Acidobacteriota bacterium]|nr:GNAT family N-acetyltransferase [Acidobacteriota bacterium]
MSVELRRASRSDAQFLLELVTGEETRAFLGRAPASLEEVLADIERSEQEPESFGWLVAEADGERIGSASYRVANERNGIVEGGRLAVHPRFRGRRLGDDLARAFQRLVLRELGFHRLEIQIYGFNERALAHAERVGYVREGVKRKAYRKNGEWQDAVLYAMLEDELPA